MVNTQVINTNLHVCHILNWCFVTSRDEVGSLKNISRLGVQFLAPSDEDIDRFSLEILGI